MPPDICDCHVHVFEPGYPVAPTAVAPPPAAPLESYLKIRRRLGLGRVVLVQQTAYGTDNRCLLEAIARLGGSARGVVVVDTGVTDAELDRLTRAGVRGVRFQMLPGGALPWEMLEEMAARVLPFGRHIQLQMDGRRLPERAEMLKRLPGTLVIDHVGKFLEPVPADSPSFRCLLDLIDGGRVWVKLSAPYEVSRSGSPGYDDVGRLARVLVAAAPQRMVWAGNWPHIGAKPSPDDRALLDLLSDWAPDEAVRHAIFVDNPATLYGFREGVAPDGPQRL